MLSLFVLVTLISTAWCEIETDVMFSAGIAHTLILNAAEKVAFDTLFTNIGAAYDTNTGTFNCPMSGIYVFEVYTLAHQDKTSWLELYHNNNYIYSIYAHQAADYGSAGNTAILKLTKGDQVYVKAVHSQFGAGTNIYGKKDEIYSTFSGYLIAPIYEDIPVSG